MEAIMRALTAQHHELDDLLAGLAPEQWALPTQCEGRDVSDVVLHLARLAWRTLPYAVEREGRDLKGSVACALTAPDGATWEFRHDDGAPSTIVRGPALDFCLVAGRRLDPAAAALVTEGPQGDEVL